MGMLVASFQSSRLRSTRGRSSRRVARCDEGDGATPASADLLLSDPSCCHRHPEMPAERSLRSGQQLRTVDKDSLTRLLDEFETPGWLTHRLRHGPDPPGSHARRRDHPAQRAGRAQSALPAKGPEGQDARNRSDAMPIPWMISYLPEPCATSNPILVYVPITRRGQPNWPSSRTSTACAIRAEGTRHRAGKAPWPWKLRPHE